MGDDARFGLAQVGDDPIVAVAEDTLDRKAFAQRSAELVSVVAAESPSVVAGLIGAWGSGKTSTLSMIAEELNGREEWTVVDFNPWELNDLASLITEFFTTLRAAIGDNRKARKALSNYAGKVAPFAAVVPGVGVASSTVMKAVGDQLLGDTSLAAERARLEKSLRRMRGKVLVLIDDVDRLQRDELTTVLKLVRLVGRLPNISYVLAYDEVTLLDVLAGTDVGGQNPRRALAYLDKIVQLRLDLPPVSTYRLRTMVETAIDEVTEAHGVELERAQAERIGAIYVESLEPSLTEPRHIKRFFGQVEAMYDLVASEVDFVDFFLITFVRVFFPSVHREILANKAELTGTKLEVNKSTDVERIARWESILGERHGLDQDTKTRVLSILGAMFPRLNRYGFGGGSTRPIASSEYFDRYVYLAIPPDDFPDAKVAAAVAEVTAGAPGAAAEELIDALAIAAEPIIDKLGRVQPGDGDEARRLLPFVARVSDAIPDGAGFLGFASRRALGLVSATLKLAAIPDAAGLLDDLGECLRLNEIAAAVEDARRDDANTSNLDAVVAELGDRLFADLTASATLEPAAAGTRFLWTLRQWEHLVGSPERAREWMRAHVDSGNWPVQDVVAMFVTIGTYGNGTQVLTGVDVKELDARLGIEWVLERFTPISSGEPTRDGTKDVSFEERRRWAHDVLARELANRHSTASGSD